MPTAAAHAMAATAEVASAGVTAASVLRAQRQCGKRENTQARNGESKLHFRRGPGLIILPRGLGGARGI